MSASFTTTQQQQFHPMSLASVLTAPLTSRGELLGRLFAESSLKELAAVYPVLLEEIFGFGGRPGWNVQLINRKCHPAEFDRVRALLQPSGPLFSVIYRLMAEPHVTYEFPAACLPASSAGGGGGGISALSPGQWALLSPQSLGGGGGGGGPAWGGSLMLSPLELYLHHFCYFLLNPVQQATPIAWTAPGDALYPTLLEDLLAHFLPCGGSWVPPLSQPSAHHHHHLHNYHPGISMAPQPQRSVTPPRLLLRSSLLRPASPGGPGTAPPASPGHSHGHLTPETWRSEALLRTAAAFWLETGSQGADHRPPSPGQNDSFSAKSILYELDPHVPSHDHVRVVRMLVKHMHSFAAAPHQLPGLEEFKRQAQSMLQKKLYGFMRHTIQHWPTDTSFRLILETWLSYIQPWRYADYTNGNRSPTQGSQSRESDRPVDESWARFVAENLLFYATIFRQLLPRLPRMELTVPKYAYMVFRLAKVMCQPGLAELVRAAEEMRTGSRWSAAGRSAAAGQSSLLYAASVGQHIIDLEEPGFTYQSMFDASCTQQVHALVRRLAEARAALQARLASLPSAASEPSSLWDGLLSALGARTPDFSGSEISSDETRRAISHLESAAAQLAKLYNLEVPEPGGAVDSPATPAGQRLPGWPYATPLGGRPFGTPLQAGSLLTPSALQSPAAPRTAPETELDPTLGLRLTKRGRHQLLSGLYRGHVTYQGDPERRPVQSCESAALLRLLQTAAGHINNAYGPELAALYQRTDLAGYVARCVLLPPAVFYELVRGPDGRSERRAVPRPAGLSLRPLADQRCLAALAAAVLAALAAGLSPSTALLLVLLVVPALLLLSAALVQKTRDWWRGCPPAQLASPQRRSGGEHLVDGGQ